MRSKPTNIIFNIFPNSYSRIPGIIEKSIFLAKLVHNLSQTQLALEILKNKNTYYEILARNLP